MQLLELWGPAVKKDYPGAVQVKKGNAVYCSVAVVKCSFCVLRS